MVFASSPEITMTEDVLSSYGDKLVDVVTGMATNEWVLAFFGFGMALVMVRSVLSSAMRRSVGAVGGGFDDHDFDDYEWDEARHNRAEYRWMRRNGWSREEARAELSGPF